MQLRSYQSGKAATPAPAVTISVDLEGRVFVDKEQVKVDELAPKIKERVDKDRKTVVYLAIADGQGKVDRAPLMQDVYDRLRTLNITVNMVGRPGLQSSKGPAAPPK
jgi:biopolymer transport protein ExbD